MSLKKCHSKNDEKWLYITDFTGLMLRMRNSLSSFEIDGKTESCAVVKSDPMLRVVAYQIFYKDDKIIEPSRWVHFSLT